MQYDYLVFIGRFQPFHNGHKHVIEEGLKISKKMIMLCGSVNRKRSKKNPWIYKERKLYIAKSFSETVLKRLYILPLADYLDDVVWVKRVEEKVKKIVADEEKNNIGIIGHQKDETSYYLNLFPKWDIVKIKNFKNISATYIRQKAFAAKDKQDIIDKIQNLVPNGVLLFLLDFFRCKSFAKKS